MSPECLTGFLVDDRWLAESRYWWVSTPIYCRRVSDQVVVQLMIFHHILPNSFSVQLRQYQDGKEIIGYYKKYENDHQNLPDV
jgi:hypothetical protein